MSLVDLKRHLIKIEPCEFIKEENTEIETDTISVKTEPLLENEPGGNIIKPENNDKQIFACSQCSEFFEYIEMYELHISTHDQLSTGIKHCPCCKKQYKRMENYTRHIQEHLGKYHCCTYCSKIFFNQNLQRKHVLEHKKNGALACPYCGKVFTIQKSLTMHIRVHTNERPYKCDKCLKGFKQLSSLRTHKELIHSEGNPQQCEICHGMFSTKSSLTRHMKRLHNTGRTISCKPCARSFPNKDLYLKHRMENHKKLSGFFEICQDCNEEFFTYREYYYHKKIHIPNKTVRRKKKRVKSEGRQELDVAKECTNLSPDEKIQICWLCGKHILSKLFTQHKNKHLLMTPEEIVECVRSKQFPCKICEYVYLSKKSLLKHMDSHMEKVFPCTKDCNTLHLFSYNGLKGHERKFHAVYKGRSKKKKCFLCGLDVINTSYNHHLNDHMQQTAEDIIQSKVTKEYLCKQCSIVVPSRSFLLKHTMSHMPKKYMCEKNSGCPRVLYTYMGLRTHYRIVHDEYTCKLCKKTFTGLQKFNAHHHKSDYISKKFGKKIFKCSWCSAKFSNPMAITHHYRTHKASDFRCRICNRRCPTAIDIKMHMNRVHRQRFTTEDCYRYLVNKVDALDTQAEEAFVCNWCKVGFSTQEALTKHAQIHTDNRYQCKKCKTCFTDFVIYASHIKHNICVRWLVEALIPEAKDLKCIYCNDAFADYFYITKHITKCHLKETYPCKFCDSKHRIESLRAHLIKRHSRRKKYLCVGCKVSFVTFKTYLQHRRWCVQCPLIRRHRSSRQEPVYRNNIVISDNIKEDQDIVDVPEKVSINEFGDIVVPENNDIST